MYVDSYSKILTLLNGLSTFTKRYSKRALTVVYLLDSLSYTNVIDNVTVSCSKIAQILFLF